MRWAVIAFLPFALLWVWYSVAADYSYKAVAGTYTLQWNGESSTLVLKQDGSFQQELHQEGNLKHSQGTWRRIGEGGVVFSREFLNTPNQEVGQTGEIYGEVQKKLGLFLSIRISQNSNGPVFHRRLLH